MLLRSRWWVVSLVVSASLNAASISNYQVIQGCAIHNGMTYTLLRSFDKQSIPGYLAVNSRTLTTTILPQNQITLTPCTPTKTRYERLHTRASEPPHPRYNDGIIHTSSGMAVTVDFCPSSKRGFDQHFFEVLIRTQPNPVPVTLFVSGLWITKHRTAFAQLRNWQRTGKLAITWGNHTYRHPYRYGFALQRGYDLYSDTLRLEKMLLRHGIIPSVFFRFPGLVSNKRAMEIVGDLGLIPIGANAWLAKHQAPHSGSIILLHGNRNEPDGIARFLRLLNQGHIQNLKRLEDAIMR